MRFLSDILSALSIAITAFVLFAAYATVFTNYKIEDEYFYKKGLYTNKYSYDDPSWTKTAFNIVPIFQKPDKYAKIIDSISTDTVFAATPIDEVLDEKSLKKIEDVDYWYVLPDNKGYVCESEIVKKQTSSNTNKNKKKRKTQYELSGHKLFQKQLSSFGELITILFKRGGSYLLCIVTLGLIFLTVFVNPRFSAKGEEIRVPLSFREYQSLKCSIPLGLIASSMLIFYIVVGLDQLDFGSIFWYINPWKVGWWVLLTAPAISSFIMINAILFASHSNYLFKIIRYKDEKWQKKILAIMTIIIYIPVGFISALLSFIFGVLGIALWAGALSAPKAVSDTLKEPIEPDVTLTDGTKLHYDGGGKFKGSDGNTYEKTGDGRFRER